MKLGLNGYSKLLECSASTAKLGISGHDSRPQRPRLLA